MGVGNLLLRDEGVGVHLAQALMQRDFPGDIDLEVIDGGVSSDAFLTLGKVDKLIVVDAVVGGCEPGAVYRFNPNDVELEKEVEVSVHQWGLLEGLKMMELAGTRPGEVVIIGIEPKDVQWGMELSDEIASKIPEIQELVLSEIYSKRSN
jgi:hydrogenase maturation protease